MSLKSSLLSVLGAIAGVLIPGASAATTQLTHSIQQHVADVFGGAAVKLANEFKLDTTGMSGPDKVFAITRALVATAKAQGFKGDLKVLGTTLVDVAQAAYRASEPSIESDIVALATALHAGPALTSVAELVGQVAQNAADQALAAGSASIAQAA